MIQPHSSCLEVTLNFEQSVYSAEEGDGSSVSVCVTLSGTSQRTVTATLSLVDGSAEGYAQSSILLLSLLLHITMLLSLHSYPYSNIVCVFYMLCMQPPLTMMEVNWS